MLLSKSNSKADFKIESRANNKSKPTTEEEAIRTEEEEEKANKTI